jgi:hypothetical protein
MIAFIAICKFFFFFFGGEGGGGGGGGGGGVKADKEAELYKLNMKF